MMDLSGPESEKKKKKKKNFCMIFKQHWLNITTEGNLRIINFLDPIFDLQTEKYYPHVKVNNKLYIHKQSNHPQSITKKIPAMISKRKFDTA